MRFILHKNKQVYSYLYSSVYLREKLNYTELVYPTKLNYLQLCSLARIVPIPKTSVRTLMNFKLQLRNIVPMWKTELRSFQVGLFLT
jgi:hypothetical protein